jgi:hypothetical protein
MLLKYSDAVGAFIIKILPPRAWWVAKWRITSPCLWCRCGAGLLRGMCTPLGRAQCWCCFLMFSLHVIDVPFKFWQSVLINSQSSTSLTSLGLGDHLTSFEIVGEARYSDHDCRLVSPICSCCFLRRPIFQKRKSSASTMWRKLGFSDSPCLFQTFTQYQIVPFRTGAEVSKKQDAAYEPECSHAC